NVDASHERFIADRLRVRREDAAVMVGYASRSHHLEIRLHHRVGRRSDDAKFAPPSEHVPHSRSSRTGNTSKRDELAPPHSITSFACARSAGGTAMPRALAVLRLITSSNLVGACTGISAGFSPLRMRST